MIRIKSNLEKLMLDWQAKNGKRLTYKGLADEVGGSINFIYRLKNDQIQQLDLEKLGAICAFFHCTPGDVLRLEMSEEKARPPRLEGVPVG